METDPAPNRIDPHLEVRERRRGLRPGDAYVRIVRPFESEFERGQEGSLVATSETLTVRGGWQRTVARVRGWLIGKPISSEREEHERLTKLKALAVFSSDNISSSAYATEEMMRVLVVAGIGAFSLVMPLTLVIVAVLAIVATSYRQTIRAYPNGASSYIVASDNLGPPVGLVAAGALLIDYTLTVAVSVSAGVAAITSIVPPLFDWRVVVAVAIVALLTIGNLRGVRESGTIFMAPTYLYVVVVLGLIGFGLFAIATGVASDYAPPASWVAAEASNGLGVLGLLLVLRAFSSGAVALTGVEAVSDGVPAFKTPEWRNARTTLTAAAVLFATLFLGISFLVSWFGILPDPDEQQTVLSILARHLTGDGPYLVLVQVATALILTLAANTSFADFPRLSSFLARDGFMPRQFGFRGDRLAFSTGIVALAALAVVLLVAFDASVSALIPLYTLGVFVAFTLSQTGMVRRWWVRREAGWRRGLLINGLGAVTTAVIVVVVAVSKFLAGAWLVMILVPILVGLMWSIHVHYRRLELAVAPRSRLRVAVAARAPLVIVPIARLDQPSIEALDFARSISADALAVHITNDPATAHALKQQWREVGGAAELVIVESPYRALIGPLLRYLDALQRQDPDRRLLVVLSEVVPRHWWDNLLHNQTALRLKLRLFFRPNTIVADVPYHPPQG
ncbi:MAG TPA: APC family permease [Candidatus Limnocylindria bacterium]|jgi:amino acid transporter|nr:APC family permease [Candidatus Limnocylindria bacterium]